MSSRVPSGREGAAPAIFSCASHPEWSAFRRRLWDHAAFFAQQPADDSRFAEGFVESRLCSSFDERLLTMANDLLVKYMPRAGFWASYAYVSRNFDIGDMGRAADCPDGTDCEMGDVCLYGIINAMACFATMLMEDPSCDTKMGVDSSHFQRLAKGMESSMEGILLAKLRLLEFVDSSTWPFHAEDDPSCVSSSCRTLLH